LVSGAFSFVGFDKVKPVASACASIYGLDNRPPRLSARLDFFGSKNTAKVTANAFKSSKNTWYGHLEGAVVPVQLASLFQIFVVEEQLRVLREYNLEEEICLIIDLQGCCTLMLTPPLG
jgi:hypothetical protein